MNVTEAQLGEAATLAGRFLLPIRMDDEKTAVASCTRVAMLIAHIRQEEREACVKVRDALERLLRWPNPNGTIEKAYIPGWLAEECRASLAPSLPKEG